MKYLILMLSIAIFNKTNAQISYKFKYLNSITKDIGWKKINDSTAQYTMNCEGDIPNINVMTADLIKNDAILIKGNMKLGGLYKEKIEKKSIALITRILGFSNYLEKIKVFYRPYIDTTYIGIGNMVECVRAIPQAGDQSFYALHKITLKFETDSTGIIFMQTKKGQRNNLEPTFFINVKQDSIGTFKIDYIKITLLYKNKESFFPIDISKNTIFFPLPNKTMVVDKNHQLIWETEKIRMSAPISENND